MGKIPVGQTIAQSYTFAFSRYFSLLGVVWLPLLLTGVLGYFLMMPFMDRLIDAMQNRDPSAGALQMFSAMRGILAFDVVAMLLLAAISVGITKEALGLRSGPRFVYLGVGVAELRVIGAYVLVFVFAYVFSMVVAIIMGILGVVLVGSLATSGTGRANPALFIAPFMPLLVMLVEFAMLYLWIRLSSLMVAVTVAERRIGLWRSWALTSGNFWRLFLIVLAIWIPLIIVEFVVGGIALGPVIAKFAVAGPQGPQAVRAAMGGLLKSMFAYMPYFWLGFLPFAPVVYGLIIAPGAFAYRALMPVGPHQSEVFD